MFRAAIGARRTARRLRNVLASEAKQSRSARLGCAGQLKLNAKPGGNDLIGGISSRHHGIVVGTEIYIVLGPQRQPDAGRQHVLRRLYALDREIGGVKPSKNML